MPEPMEQFLSFLQTQTVRQPVIDFVTSLINTKFDPERFTEEVSSWLAGFRQEQERLTKQQHELQSRQSIQLIQLQQEQELWAKRLEEMQGLLVRIQAESFEKHQRYLELLTELHHDHQALPSLGVQRQRLAMALAFLPQLPTVVTSSELGVLFGGIDVALPNPYLPPREATVRIVLHQFECLPKAEQSVIGTLVDQLKNSYKLSLHPVYQLRNVAHQKMLVKTISILRSILHERTKG